MDDFLWVLGFLVRNLLGGVIVGAVASAILWFFLYRSNKRDK